MGKCVCMLCPKSNFSSIDAVIQHIKSQHMGKLSDSSIEYLLSLGVKPGRIIEFCKNNRIKVDESKVYRIALKLEKLKLVKKP